MLLNTAMIAQTVVAVANVAVVSARAFAVCVSTVRTDMWKPTHAMPAWHQGFSSEHERCQRITRRKPSRSSSTACQRWPGLTRRAYRAHGCQLLSVGSGKP